MPLSPVAAVRRCARIAPCRAGQVASYADVSLSTRERPTPNHYERLGVAPSASTDEIRSAYRALARRLHSDRLGQVTAAERILADRRMREINESWQVLQDPGRRRRYDESLLTRRPRSSGSTGAARSAPRASQDDDDDLIDVMGPMSQVQAGLFRHLPWVVLLVVFAAIFVFSAYATADKSAPSRRGVTAGTCLDTSAGTSTTIVSCSGPHDLQVLDRVADPGDCPEGTEGRRLGRDTLFDCVVRSSG